MSPTAIPTRAKAEPITLSLALIAPFVEVDEAAVVVVEPDPEAVAAAEAAEPVCVPEAEGVAEASG